MTPSADPTARADALAVLGLPETATRAQIAHAYRRLVRVTHPDATGRTDPGAAQEFAAINHAYQLLSHADHPVEEPVEEPVEASPPAGLDDASAASPEAGSPEAGSSEARSSEAWFPQARRLPPMGVPGFHPRPPIVAGPTVVTPLPEQHQRHRRRPR